MISLPVRLIKLNLRYDPETGHFWWIKGGPHRRKNVSAGTLTKKGYIDIRLYRKGYKASRLAWAYMTGSWPKAQIDHKNRTKTDNRWSNLREATQSQNSMNIKKATNFSGVRGVYFHKRQEKWTASISINGQHYNLGYFASLEEATQLRNEVAKEFHGEFANV